MNDKSFFDYLYEKVAPITQPKPPQVFMKMAAKEHGQPYKSTSTVTWKEGPMEYEYTDYVTFMAVKQHGQPYKSQSQSTTDMAVKQHGQPYKGPGVSRMIIREHGQPYKGNTHVVSHMAVREHGQPYKSDPQPYNFSSVGQCPWDK